MGHSPPTPNPNHPQTENNQPQTRLNKPEQRNRKSSTVRTQAGHPSPEGPDDRILTQTTHPSSQFSHPPPPSFAEANIEAIAHAINALVSVLTPSLSSPLSPPHSHPQPSHTQSLLTAPPSPQTSRLAYIYMWCRAFAAGHVPPQRPPHLLTPSSLFRAGRWLRRRMSLMSLCICVCVGALGVTAGVAVALQDNYSCIGGEHTVWATGGSVWSVVSHQCSGSRQHAYEAVVSLNTHVEPWHLVPGEVLTLPSSGG